MRSRSFFLPSDIVRTNKLRQLGSSVLACCLMLGMSCTILADELEDSALSIAPKDAAFFSTTLDGKKSFEEFVQGEFVQEFLKVPYVQEFTGEMTQQWEDDEGQAAQARSVIESPIVQNLLKLVGEMISDEIFIYGSGEWTDNIAAMGEFQTELMQATAEGPEGVEAMLNSLTKEDLEKFKIPTIVMGFRIEDVDNAVLQMDGLEGFARLGGSQVEALRPLLDRLKKSKFEDGQSLTLTLDTSLIPMDSIPVAERQSMEPMLAMLDGRSISFGVGIKSNMMLMAFGENASLIESVGQSDEHLIDHPAFEIVREMGAKNLRSIAYVSEELLQKQWDVGFESYFQNIASQFTNALEEEVLVNGQDNPEWKKGMEEWLAEIKLDAEWMDEKLGLYNAEFGPVLSWSSKIDGGMEGYSYNGAKGSAFENASPLAVLEHIGDNPLVVFAFKQKTFPAMDEFVQYAFKKAPGHIKRFVAMAEQDEAEAKFVLAQFDKMMPLLEETYEVMRDKIGKATSDNETLVTVSTGMMLDYVPELPPPPSPLPVPEIAMASKINDRELFMEGGQDLFAIADQVLEMVREADPESVPPNFEIPRPEQIGFDGGAKFTYSDFNQQIPMDGFEPAIVVGEEAMVVGYSEGQMKSMMRAASNGLDWLDDTKPVAAVSYIDFEGIVGAMRPWMELGLATTETPLDEPLGPSNAGEPVPTGNDVLAMWDCLKTLGTMQGTTVVQEDGTTLSHWIWK
ncbi:MAG: hypothetical protein AAF483_13885 [Planctomycetota bacterium]